MVGEKSKFVRQDIVELLYRLLCAVGLGAVTGAAAGYAAAAAAGRLRGCSARLQLQSSLV